MQKQDWLQSNYGFEESRKEWIISKFVDEYNHKILTLRITSFLCGHQKITTAQKNLINTLNNVALEPRFGDIMVI